MGLVRAGDQPARGPVRGTEKERIVWNETRSGSSATTSYEYFRLDETGLVVESPRGYAKDYTKRVRVTDIAEVAQKQAVPDPEAPRFQLGF